MQLHKCCPALLRRGTANTFEHAFVFSREEQAAGHKVRETAGIDISEGSISASVTYRYAKNCLILNSLWHLLAGEQL